MPARSGHGHGNGYRASRVTVSQKKKMPEPDKQYSSSSSSGSSNPIHSPFFTHYPVSTSSYQRRVITTTSYQKRVEEACDSITAKYQQCLKTEINNLTNIDASKACWLIKREFERCSKETKKK